MLRTCNDLPIIKDPDFSDFSMTRTECALEATDCLALGSANTGPDGSNLYSCKSCAVLPLRAEDQAKSRRLHVEEKTKQVTSLRVDIRINVTQSFTEPKYMRLHNTPQDAPALQTHSTR